MECKGCAYDGVECAVFLKRPEDCWNYTTKDEAEKREQAIKEYAKSDHNCPKVTTTDHCTQKTV